MPSADGKGRTLLDILRGRNKKDMRPLEFQYHNPLEAKVGCTINFDHEPDISGINFVIEKISVYKTTINSKDFYHTDYHLKGISLDHDKPVRMKLRLIPDQDVIHALGHKVQLLYLYDEMPYNESFHNVVLGEESGILDINEADDGTQLDEPRRYWRVGHTDHCPRPDPYDARCTVLSDVDGNGTIDDDELEHYNTTYWEFSRMTEDELEQEFEEFLTIEMNVETGFFTFLRGASVEPSQIFVF